MPKKLLDILQDQSINLLMMAGVGKSEARTYVADALAFDQNWLRLLNQPKNGQITQQSIIQ